MALDKCIEIVCGRLSENTKVVAYTANREKALKILRGDLSQLRGRKVESFYHNTLDSTNERFITVDGHMLGAWCNMRLKLKREAQVRGNAEYEQIAQDFRRAAKCTQLPAPQFQAVLWLTWKRVNRILYSPQMSFEWEGENRASTSGQLLSYHPSYLNGDGKLPSSQAHPDPEAWDTSSITLGL
jgi:hypothetical protein